MADPSNVTQARHPFRAVLRTTTAVVIPLLLLLPQIVDVANLSHVNWAELGWTGAAVLIAGALTRILAMPAVNAGLQKVFPPLAAAPANEPVPPAVESVLRRDVRPPTPATDPSQPFNH